MPGVVVAEAVPIVEVAVGPAAGGPDGGEEEELTYKCPYPLCDKSFSASNRLHWHYEAEHASCDPTKVT
eukprot:8504357-Heterocapsa_arctica.AAC.1